jgi:hypothetical protein
VEYQITVAPNDLKWWWHTRMTIDRIACAIGALLFLSGIVHGAVLIATGASWDGPLSLRKAATFGLSFGITLVNVVWIQSYLRLTPGIRRMLLGAFAGACLVETALVSMQAWRGVPSHFNLETTFDGIVARMLAAGGAVLVIVITWLAVVAWRTRPHAPASLGLAIRMGLLVLVAAQLVGALMIARGMLLVFAGHAQAAYDTAGFLKPAHAVAMHGVFVLPLLAYGLSFLDWPEQRRLQIVRFASAAYILLTILVVAYSVRSA